MNTSNLLVRTLSQKRSALSLVCLVLLAACQPHTATPSTPTATSAASPKKHPIPAEWVRAKAMSSQERLELLADTRWAAPAEDYRKLLQEVESTGDKMTDEKVQETNRLLTTTHQALKAATGKQFVEVFYALRAEYSGTPKQHAAFKRFSARVQALHRKSVAARGTANLSPQTPTAVVQAKAPHSVGSVPGH